MKRVVSLAAAHGIRVVPEFDVPGHTTGILSTPIRHPRSHHLDIPLSACVLWTKLRQFRHASSETHLTSLCGPSCGRAHDSYVPQHGLREMPPWLRTLTVTTLSSVPTVFSTLRCTLGTRMCTTCSRSSGRRWRVQQDRAFVPSCSPDCSSDCSSNCGPNCSCIRVVLIIALIVAVTVAVYVSF